MLTVHFAGDAGMRLPGSCAACARSPADRSVESLGGRPAPAPSSAQARPPHENHEPTFMTIPCRGGAGARMMIFEEGYLADLELLVEGARHEVGNPASD
jgi:hypothetical protein